MLIYIYIPIYTIRPEVFTGNQTNSGETIIKLQQISDMSDIKQIVILYIKRTRLNGNSLR